MTLLTLDEVKAHVETDLEDTALQRIVTGIESEISDRYGSTDSAEETVAGTDRRVLVTHRPIESITSITEDDVTLSANDYRQWGRYRLERLSSGDNPRTLWGGVVELQYTPRDDSEQRKLVLVDLVKLELEYRALQSESVGGGDYRANHVDYTRERTRLLRMLAPKKVVFA
jgi:hypothetical protein